MIRLGRYLGAVTALLWIVQFGCSAPEAPPSNIGTATKVHSRMVSPPPPQLPPPPPPPPPPPLPPAPGPPRRPMSLSVPDFYPASHVGPDDTSVWPKPVTVVLHGNFDRPEWECDMWKDVAGFHGWVLCPRGVRTPWATLKEDRWTYRGPGVIQKEIDAAISALEKRYPGRVLREETVLAGFSLGGIYAPSLAMNNPGRYPYVFLVEGGVKKLDKRRIRSMKRAGVKGLGMAMSAPGRRRMAKNALRLAVKAGLQVVFVDMKGAGHAYRGDFGRTGRAGLKKLLEPAAEEGVPEGGP